MSRPWDDDDGFGGGDDKGKALLSPDGEPAPPGSHPKLQHTESSRAAAFMAQDSVTDEIAAAYRPSLYITWAVCVLFFIDFSIVNPTLFPYVASLCGSESFYAWTQAVYGLSQVVSSAVFGIWAAKRTVKEGLIISLLLMLLGNLMYAAAPLVTQLPDGQCTAGSVCVWPVQVNNICTKHTVGKYMIFFGRVIGGLGGGCVTVAFGFFPRVTTLKERVWAFSSARSLMSLAFVGSPALSAGFAFLACKCTAGSISEGNPFVNQYTLPAMATAVFTVILLAVVMCQFKNPPPAPPPPKVKAQYNFVLVALVVNACMSALITSAFGLVIVPATHNEYGWNDFENSLMFASFGIVLIFSSVFAMAFSKCVSARATLLVGALAITLGCLAEIPPQPEYHNFSDALYFVFACIGVTGGYGMVSAICPAIFAQMIPDSHKQTMMATIPFFSSIARVVGPILAGYTYNSRRVCTKPPYVIWCSDRGTEVVLSGIMLFGILFQVCTWKRMVTPYERSLRHAKHQGLAPSVRDDSVRGQASGVLRLAEEYGNGSGIARGASEVALVVSPPRGNARAHPPKTM